MKKIILFLVVFLSYLFFSSHHISADYSQDLDACNKILSKSSSVHEYCNLHIDAISGDRVTGPMVSISNAYIYPESGVARAAKFLEEEYKSTIKRWQALDESQDLTPEVKKSGGVIEETGPDNIKFLINKMPFMRGINVLYTYHSYLFKQQGSCVMVVDGTANIGYVKSQNKINDVSGDVESLKKESIIYINKVGNDLMKNCREEIIKTETPTVPALIDKPPKENDFRKVDRSDFKLVYPVGTSSANLKPATQSTNLKGDVFIGKVGGEGDLLVEFPKGQTITLKDDYTGVEAKEAHVVWQHNVKLLNHRFTFHISEIDCHIQIARDIARAEGDATSLMNLGVVLRPGQIIHPERINVITGDCSDLNIESLVRIFVQKGPAILNMQNSSVFADQNADFGFFDDTDRGVSTVEIYNGSVTIKNKSGQTKTISSVYGSEIKQIEVTKDGTMSERTAIPQSEWEAFLASQQKKNNLSILPIVLVLGIGGLIFFLFKTGKLVPLYRTSAQKIFELMGKIKKTGQEKNKIL